MNTVSPNKANALFLLPHIQAECDKVFSVSHSKSHVTLEFQGFESKLHVKPVCWKVTVCTPSLESLEHVLISTGDSLYSVGFNLRGRRFKTAFSFGHYSEVRWGEQVVPEWSNNTLPPSMDGNSTPSITREILFEYNPLEDETTVFVPAVNQRYTVPGRLFYIQFEPHFVPPSRLSTSNAFVQCEAELIDC
eukprot:TRINITY_DN67286_c8_g2_i1.p1 TRINITY_DN67286_c8_g2~~TRINITY_DN67286_c8_g2_i1.p1  ORF type:complete len:191 (-),score=6.87 TRINITY_DN67286_c8_g2_i1:41-613(-)